MAESKLTTTIDVLIVEEDERLRSSLARRFSGNGFQVYPCCSSEKALAQIDSHCYDVIILDMQLHGVSGLQFLDQLKKSGAESEVIGLNESEENGLSVQARKLGAYDILSKPIGYEELVHLVHKAYEASKLRKENQRLRAVLRRTQIPSRIIGQSPPMKEVFRLVERIGPTHEPALIQGESGTGKELIAHAIHRASRLQEKPLVVLNCAALSETLLESELFGHERGAFTGAIATKPGLFEVADGGTLFIDEIGELAGSLQAKLLRVLEDGTMRRVGSVKQRRVNVRLIAATNRDLVREVEANRFREDLFYRINVLTLELPPLRERRDDIPLLVEHFCGDRWKIEKSVLQLLASYDWPGNIRQLQNAIQRAKILAENYHIRMQDLPPEIKTETNVQKGKSKDWDTNLDSLKKKHILEVLRQYQGNKARTARALGIGRRSLYRLLDKFQISNVC